MNVRNVNVFESGHTLYHEIDTSKIKTRIVGNFELKTAPNSTYTLYALDLDDLIYVAERINMPTKGTIYRVQTSNMEAGGMSLLVQVSLDKGLVYFMKHNEDNDSILEFETKGIKPKFINYILPGDNDL